MSKKQLIVAADVRLVAKSADKRIHLHQPNAIVTAEARSLAKELGVELSFDQSAPVCDPPPSPPVDQDAVRRVIEAQTHGPASEAVLAEVLRRIAQERTRPATAPGHPADDAPEPAAQVAQIRKITSLCASPKTSSSAFNMSQLDLASLGLTSAAPCACGFMGWSNKLFPFTRSSDEINLVLEGELQFHVGQVVISAKAGDVMWLPKGAQGQIGTLDSVRFFFLTYPV